MTYDPYQSSIQPKEEQDRINKLEKRFKQFKEKYESCSNTDQRKLLLNAWLGAMTSSIKLNNKK